MLAFGAAVSACGGSDAQGGGGFAVDAGRQESDASVVRDAGAVAPVPDAGPDSGGRAGTALVPGGVSAKSANYSIVMTLGQSPGGNTTMSSQKSKINSGVVGANQPGK